MINTHRSIFHVLTMVFLLSQSVFAEVRIKDIARVKTDPDNQLIGYGLVIGLNGTGDKGKTVFTPQAMANMLEKMGISVAADSIKVKNVAAVMVTSRVSSFAKEGSRIDVSVASIGDADSLKGGTLVITPLKALDGQIYATAEGPVAIESVKVKALREATNTTGRVPGGALLLREIPSTAWVNEENGRQLVNLILHQPDFTTSRRMASIINDRFPGLAEAIDPGQVRVFVDPRRTPVEFVADIERIEVEPDNVARVVINERTGTVVMGQNVMISPVAISHGSLNIEIGSATAGKTKKNRSAIVLEGASVDEIVKSLNLIGVTPRDIIDIFQAIKRAGAMQAELEIM